MEIAGPKLLEPSQTLWYQPANLLHCGSQGSNINITVDNSRFEDGTPAKIIKIEAENFALTAWLKPDELSKLFTFLTKKYETGSVKAGKSANSDVYWMRDGNMINILVGRNEQEWDFGISIPSYILEHNIRPI